MRAKDHSWSKSTGALVGSLVTTLAACVVIAQHAPLGRETRFALAFFLLLPLWITGVCVSFLARSGLRVWAAHLGLSAVLLVILRTSMH
ncbi:Hypothetical protein A7982_09630 [Minicystis rosea]|nr:Hypothetical protein A7982_09630 [Minicystis rosea]